MYLATVTTERERTGALMILTIPQALSMFFAPIVASKVAVYSTLRISQMLNGALLAGILLPTVYFLLPTTHSIPRLAAARLRPQVFFKIIFKPRVYIYINQLYILAWYFHKISKERYPTRNLRNSSIRVHPKLQKKNFCHTFKTPKNIRRNSGEWSPAIRHFVRVFCSVVC